MGLFCSYHSTDEILVEEVARILRTAGLRPWWARDLEPGIDWKAELQRQIATCQVFLCLLSRDSLKSDWCRWERKVAIAQRKPIIPVFLRSTELPIELKHLHWIDLSDGLHGRNLSKLVAKLSQANGTGSPVDEEAFKEPFGSPSRFRQPLPKDYRTVSQAFLAPMFPEARRYEISQILPSSTSPEGPILGIDFGTTHSSIASFAERGPLRKKGPTLIPNSRGATSIPSAVAISTSGVPEVGEQAVATLTRYPERGVLEVKRLFSRGLSSLYGGPPVLEVDGIAYTPVDLAALIFRELRTQAELALGASASRVVLAKPAYFDPSETASLMRAAELGGISIERVVPEPVAACLSATTRLEGIVVVYDLGGGTFDVSVLDTEDGVFEVKSVAGDSRIGGADFDRVIVDHCVAEFREATGIELSSNASALIRIREAAERAKIDLSTVTEQTIAVPNVAMMNGEPLHLDVPITRTELNELVYPFVSRTIELTRMALADAEVRPTDVDHVVIVGRASRTHCIVNSLHDLFQQPPRKLGDTSVAEGAARQAGVLGGLERSALLLDALPFTLRVRTKGNLSVPLIARNRTFPRRSRRDFSVTTDPQRAISVRILAGDHCYGDANLLVCEVVLSRRKAKGLKGELEVVLGLDANSRLRVDLCHLGKPLASKEIGLATDTQWIPEQDLRSRNDYEVPQVAAPLKLPPLTDRLPSEEEDLDHRLLEHWLARVIVEDLKRQGVSDSDSDWLSTLASHVENPEEPLDEAIAHSALLLGAFREELVDQLELKFGIDLKSARHESSIRGAAHKLRSGLAKGLAVRTSGDSSW